VDARTNFTMHTVYPGQLIRLRAVMERHQGKGTMVPLQALSVRGWTSAFLLDVHGLCGAIEGRLSHPLTCLLRTGWQSAISQENSLEILCHG